MCRQQGELLAHVDHPHRVEDAKDHEEDQGDAEEDDDQGGGGFGESCDPRLHFGLHRGDGPGGRGGGWWHDAGAVVRLHHHPHLAAAVQHHVLRCAQVRRALGKLWTGVGEAGVGAVGVVPQVRHPELSVVPPGVARSDGGLGVVGEAAVAVVLGHHGLGLVSADLGLGELKELYPGLLRSTWMRTGYLRLPELPEVMLTSYTYYYDLS